MEIGEDVIPVPAGVEGSPPAVKSENNESLEEFRSPRKRKVDSQIALAEDERSNIPVIVDLSINLSTDEFVEALIKHNKVKEYSCQNPSCKRTFTSMEEYNTHYMTKHMYKCSVCKKQLPGSHFLELHVLENHDTLFSLMAKKKPMFACLAEECQEKFATAEDRYDHYHEQHKNHELFSTFQYFQNISQNSQRPVKAGKKKVHKSPQREPLQSGVPVEAMEEIVESEVQKPDSNNTAMEEASVSETSKKPINKDKEIKSRRGTKDNKNASKQHIQFGHHAAPTFRQNWYSQSESQPNPKCENNMDLSSMRDVLDQSAGSATVE